MTDCIVLNPIGFVSSTVTECIDRDWGNVTSHVVLKQAYVGALSGLEEFSHVIIVTYLHHACFVPAKHLLRRPQGREDMPEVGILSQRAKDRPNPIGITVVSVVHVAEDHLEVKGLDAIDNTPVLDVKPYYPQYDRVEDPRIPRWVSELMMDYF